MTIGNVYCVKIAYKMGLRASVMHIWDECIRRKAKYEGVYLGDFVEMKRLFSTKRTQ